MKVPPRCDTYDQILNRGCCYYAGHGGRHNFAHLDHDARLERALRAELDAAIAERDRLRDLLAEACDALHDTGVDFANAAAERIRKDVWPRT